MTSRLFPALGLLVLTAAPSVADNNATFLLQGDFGSVGGQSNSALIDQSAGNQNQAGSAARPVQQDGINNALTVQQSGNQNSVGLANTNVLGGSPGLRQRASTGGTLSNTATIEQLSNGNAVGALLQTARDFAGPQSGNDLTVKQWSGDGNVIAAIRQGRDAGREGNVAEIEQQGAGNRIDGLQQWSSGAVDGRNDASILIVGDDNGGSGLNSFSSRSGAVGSLYLQGEIGGPGPQGDNLLTLEIVGDRNQTGTTQYGTGNAIHGLTSATPASVLGNDNALGVLQLGMDNIANLQVSGDRNDIGLRQDGVANEGTIVLVGPSDENRVWFDQLGSDNIAEVTISGNLNTVELEQDGLGNNSLFTVTGNGNMIDGRQDGTMNRATVTQTGDMNVTTFQQIGGHNVVTVTQ